MPAFAKNVVLEDRRFIIDGEDFPWYITEEGVQVESRNIGEEEKPFLMHYLTFTMMVPDEDGFEDRRDPALQDDLSS